ncbi:MAG: sulfotransferase family protein [Pseudonocardiales bacterium]|nr:MAG: sulfotransferase family protein [Pseudonocardiales bacterium]
MLELLMEHVEHAGTWRDAIDGRAPDWDQFLAGYTAAVDWPASWTWRELADAFPDAVVLLSSRASAETWYRSVEGTVLQSIGRIAKYADPAQIPPSESRPSQWADASSEHLVALGEVFTRMGSRLSGDRDTVMASYERHLAEVRATIPPGRLLDWQPTDGWEPLCAALDVPVPDEPFPHENSSEVFRARIAQAMNEPSDGAPN